MCDGAPGTRHRMDPSRGEPVGGEPARRPEPDARPAAAVAPPPRSGRLLALFLSSLVLLVCSVAGVLLLFTPQPVGYAVLVLTLAALAAVALGITVTRPRR